MIISIHPQNKINFAVKTSFNVCDYNIYKDSQSQSTHLYHISFIFITWILTGLQNPYGYGNSHICVRIQEVKSVQKCTIFFTRPSIIFEDLTKYKLL